MPAAWLAGHTEMLAAGGALHFLRTPSLCSKSGGGSHVPHEALQCLTWPWAEWRRGAAKHVLTSMGTCFCWHVCAASGQQLANITVFVHQDEVAGFRVITSLLDTFHYTHFFAY